jgi:ACR3 family arsenite transporter
VLAYLGISTVTSIITRDLLRWLKRNKWYINAFLPSFGPLALDSLIYIIIVMFANQDRHIIENIGFVFRVNVPLLYYFVIMLFIPFSIRKMMFKLPYELIATQSFTADSNNFELVIVVVSDLWGINLKKALAAPTGLLIEVSALAILLYITLCLKEDIEESYPVHANA